MGEQQSSEVTEHTKKQSEVECILCFVETKRVRTFFLCRTYCDWYSIPRYVGGLPVLEEEGPSDMLFQQDGVSTHFHKKVVVMLSHKFVFQFVLDQ
jgi:hypothetical protein